MNTEHLFGNNAIDQMNRAILREYAQEETLLLVSSQSGSHRVNKINYKVTLVLLA